MSTSSALPDVVKTTTGSRRRRGSTSLRRARSTSKPPMRGRLRSSTTRSGASGGREAALAAQERQRVLAVAHDVELDLRLAVGQRLAQQLDVGLAVLDDEQPAEPSGRITAGPRQGSETTNVAPCAGRRLDADAAPVGLHDLLHDGQAHAGARVLLGRVQPLEQTEHALVEARVDPHAVVGDRDAPSGRRAGGPRRVHLRGRLAAVLQAVGDQVLQHRGQLARVRADDRAGRRA